MQRMLIVSDGPWFVRSAVAACLLMFPGCQGETLKPKHSLTGHTDAVLAIAASPSGELATASCDGTVRLWNLQTETCLATIPTGQCVTDLEYSLDGKLLAGATRDKIKIWDAETGSIRMTFSHAPAGYPIAFVDNETLAVASFNRELSWRMPDSPGEIIFLNVARGTRVGVFAGTESLIRSLVCSPDGRLLASAHKDGSVHLWEVATGKLVRSLKGTGPIYCTVFSPDGKTIAASFDREVVIWDVAKGTKKAAFEHRIGPNFSFDVSPDGLTLVSAAHYSKTVKFWDVQTQELRTTLLGDGYGKMPFVVKFLSGGNLIAIGGGLRSSARLAVWTLSSVLEHESIERGDGPIISSKPPEPLAVEAMEPSPNGDQLAATANPLESVWLALDSIVAVLTSVRVRDVIVWALAGLMLGIAVFAAAGSEWVRRRLAGRQVDWSRVSYVFAGLLCVRLLSDGCPMPGGALVDTVYFFAPRVVLFGLAALLIPVSWFLISNKGLRWGLAVFFILLAFFLYPFPAAPIRLSILELLPLSLVAILQTARYLAFPFAGVLGVIMALVTATLLATCRWRRQPAESLPLWVRLPLCLLWGGVLMLVVWGNNGPVWRAEGMPLLEKLPVEAESVKREDVRRTLRYARHTGAEPWLLAAIKAVPEPKQLGECALLAREVESQKALEAFLAITPRARWTSDPVGIQALRHLLELAAHLDATNDIDTNGTGYLEKTVERLFALPVRARMAVTAAGYLLAGQAGQTALAERFYVKGNETAREFPWSRDAANMATLQCFLQGTVATQMHLRSGDLLRNHLNELTSSATRTDRLAVLAVGARMASELKQEDLLQECFRQLVVAAPGATWTASEAEREAIQQLLTGVIRLSNPDLVRTDLEDAFDAFVQATKFKDRVVALAVLAKFADKTDMEGLRDQCLNSLFEAANLIEDEFERATTLSIVYDISREHGSERFLESLADAISADGGLWFPHERAKGLLRCSEIAHQCGHTPLAHRLLVYAVAELQDSYLKEQKQAVWVACVSLATQFGRRDLVTRHRAESID